MIYIFLFASYKFSLFLNVCKKKIGRETLFKVVQGQIRPFILTGSYALPCEYAYFFYFFPVFLVVTLQELHYVSSCISMLCSNYVSSNGIQFLLVRTDIAGYVTTFCFPNSWSESTDRTLSTNIEYRVSQRTYQKPDTFRFIPLKFLQSDLFVTLSKLIFITFDCSNFCYTLFPAQEPIVIYITYIRVV